MFGRLARLGCRLGLGFVMAVAGCAPAPVPAVPTATATASQGQAGSATLSPIDLAFRVVARGLASPVDIASAGDGTGRTFVVEQAGRIRIVNGSTVVGRPFLDITAKVRSGGEQGLLGLAVHPGFRDDPRIVVNYTDLEGNTVVSEFRVDATNPDIADPSSERVLLRIEQPFANHNGGGLAFGPDGMLYIAAGDGGSGGDPQGNGQRLDTFLAKILRIDVDGSVAGSGPAYEVPPDNPFVGVTGASPEIWLTGLRNPWRIRFDIQTGDLWIGDVGQNAWEEIDVARAGEKGLNFGWNRMEGFHCFAPGLGCDERGLTLPVAEYGHDLGCAVIGGVVARHTGQSLLDSRYLFGDSCSGNLWVLDPAGSGRQEPALAGHVAGSISSITQGDDGTILATDLQNGDLLAISAAAR